MTSRTLSELLRAWMDHGGAGLLHGEPVPLFTEILQALDDKQKLEANLEARTILAGTFLDARIQQLESDNERYRATILQLEKELAEAVERVRVLEKRYRGERGSF